MPHLFLTLSETPPPDATPATGPMLTSRQQRGYANRPFDMRALLRDASMAPSAPVSGWPADVPLPVDRGWKSDYAASVGRLIRDGVDAPLANLFTHVARTVSPDDEEANPARSATEAFLYRRLQTLPETAGRFRLNAELSIPFDGNGRMEVDLLCAESRLAIELDGAQHLDNSEAYRRDRRKDMLLQEHGYFVLRFPAEDVGKHLDIVLDAILRAMSHRSRGSCHGPQPDSGYA